MPDATIPAIPGAPSIAVPPTADLPAIVKAAGGRGEAIYSGGRLYVAGVTQEALDAALAKVGAGPAPPPVRRARTYKSDIWRRCTDAEAERLDAALEQASVKMRRLWDDSTVLMHEAAEFALLREPMVAVFGEARATELLAPSYWEE